MVGDGGLRQRSAGARPSAAVPSEPAGDHPKATNIGGAAPPQTFRESRMTIDYSDCFVDYYDLFYDALYCYIHDSGTYEIIQLMPV